MNYYYLAYDHKVNLFRDNKDRALNPGERVLAWAGSGREVGVIKKAILDGDEEKYEKRIREKNDEGHIKKGREQNHKENFYIIGNLREEDETRYQNLIEKEKDALAHAQALIKKLKLDMDLVDVHISFDENRTTYNYSSWHRVDFRELLKELTRESNGRIELRQIGVRDKTKIIGGVGVCGKTLCCHQCKTIPDSITIKMAKAQGLGLNSEKISGVCGRLMCCISYEYDLYKKLSHIPDLNELVLYEQNKYRVTSVRILDRKVEISDKEGKKILVGIDEVKNLGRKHHNKNEERLAHLEN